MMDPALQSKRKSYGLEKKFMIFYDGIIFFCFLFSTTNFDCIVTYDSAKKKIFGQ